MGDKFNKLLDKAKRNENESSISSAEVKFSDEISARKMLGVLKTRILNIKEWNRHGFLSTYSHFDELGKQFDDKHLQIGSFIRIWLKATGKYDWVKVVDIYEASDEFIITVKPTYDPSAEDPDETRISHFFTDASTNNFCLLKNAEIVEFYVIGLDEKRNTTETENVVESARNLAINISSYFGIQTAEWEKFCKSFLDSAVDEGNFNSSAEAV